MYLKELKEALRYNRTNHPERTNATFERVVEVIENILGENGKTVIADLKKNVDVTHPRAELTEKQSQKIVSILDAAMIRSREMEDMVNQLQYSEISSQEAIEIHKKYKIPVSHLEKEIIPVKGNGCWIRDTKGKWYIDLDSNYSATNLGMSNNEIARGLFNQADLLISMKEDRVQIARTRFLKEIQSMMPEGLHYFYWQNSGGEAVDKAIKIAKAYTKNKDVIAFKQGFHGRTHGAVSVTWNEAYRKPFHLHREDWVHFATFNDIDSVEKIVNETNAKTIIMELVQGEEAGNLAADETFLNELWQLKKDQDLLIIDDEVQAGFGRTAVKKGDWFACTSYDLVPDIITIGKSFGGSYPVTAVVTNKVIASSMKPGYDGSTFGGNPMAMTAALIATRQMKEQKITENVIKRSKQFFEGLQQLEKKYSVINDIRGRGLMIAFSLGNEKNVELLRKYLQKEGVKTSLSTNEYMRFLPPTIISKGEVEFVLQKLENALKKL